MTKVLKISVAGREIGKLPLTEPTILIGRSPVCNLVVRKKRLLPVHFIVEWFGVGEFNPNFGKWTVFNIANHIRVADKQVDDSSYGEGLILSDKMLEIDGVEFSIVVDKLGESHLEKGLLKDNLIDTEQANNIHDKKNKFVLEVITINTDSSSVAHVQHYNVLHKNEIILPQLNKTKFQCLNTSLGYAAKFNLAHLPGAVVYQKGQQILDAATQNPKTEVKIDNQDLVKVNWRLKDYYFRFVPYIPAPKAKSGLRASPFIMSMFSTLAFILILLMIIKSSDIEVIPEVKEPPRIAKIEVKEIAPQPTPVPTPEPVAQATPQPMPVATPPPKPVEEVKQIKTPTKNDIPNNTAQAAKSAAKFQNQNDTKKPSQNTGLNSPAKQENVNSVGLLGALKKSPSQTISADQVMNNSIVSDTVTGANSKFAIAQPPSGIVGAEMNKNPKPSLSGASTTLNQGDNLKNISAGQMVGNQNRKLGDSKQFGLVETSGEMDVDGVTSISGGLDKESVRRTINTYRREIQTCYERALSSKSKLGGRIVYKWGITPSGPVSYVNLVKAETGSPKLEDCVLQVIKSMVFPKAQNGQPTIVIYPFVFQSK